MAQIGLFKKQPEHMPLADGGWLDFYPCWLSPAAADTLFIELRDTLAWRQNHVKLFGKTMPEPRLSVWIGDADASYTYSGSFHRPTPWPQCLQAIRKDLRRDFGYAPNSVLLNYYRNENDSMGLHADDEKELGKNPVIASLSLGETRRFRLKHRHKKELRKELELTNGSLLVMGGTLQRYWKHEVPKERLPKEGRINLTFRQVLIK